MPLRDHFRPPVSKTHSWDEVFGGWPPEIVRSLRSVLPSGFRSGPRISIAPKRTDLTQDDGEHETVTNPPPTLTVEADIREQDQYEVFIYDVERGRKLVAAIELVSPSNKDRPDSRESFIGKVAELLRQDVCVLIFDLVTESRANLYAELLALLGKEDPKLSPVMPHIYAVSLRTRKRPKRRGLLDAWFYPMTVGEPLPTLPIWLTPELVVQLPLEVAYQETCQVLDIS
jgi:Protein of unknown function (DUF4058)